MTEAQKQFLRDLAYTLEFADPLTYADQTRFAMLIKEAFHAEAFRGSYFAKLIPEA